MNVLESSSGNVHAVGSERAAPIKIAITALGGQGGGVLSQWIVDTAEANGYVAQSTSVPGVAQRTGATLYYVEIMPRSSSNRAPVLSLMPTKGDVDIVIGAEMMEAGRAMLRGLVTKDKTTLIASTHREYAISERSAMGNGIQASDNVLKAGERYADRFIAFDMAEVAAETQSVISSVLFGALAGSGKLPFARTAFEDTIRASGRAVETNLAGFSQGYLRAENKLEALEAENPSDIYRSTTPKGANLIARVRELYPTDIHDIVIHGLRRLIDYQGFRYAERYLDRLTPIAAADQTEGFELTKETARYLALWMSFEDTIRVADLKTRDTRFERVRSEVRARETEIVRVSEFLSPRPLEICELMPAPIGRLALRSRVVQKLLGVLFNKGRRVTTTSTVGFLMLFFVGGLSWYRPITLKFSEENERINEWLVLVQEAADSRNYGVAAELVELQRLVKGYSATFERGVKNYRRILAAYRLDIEKNLPPEQVAMRLRTLREAALADEDSEALEKEFSQLKLAYA